MNIDKGQKSDAAAGHNQARRGSDSGPKRPTPVKVSPRRASAPNVTTHHPKEHAAQVRGESGNQAGAREKPKDEGTADQAKREEKEGNAAYPYQHAHKL